MKRILFTCGLLFSVFIFNAQTKLWSGAGDGSSWSDAQNWNPAGVPGLADNVLLDNSGVTLTYTVKLPTGNTDVSINSLTITPAGSNNITLQLPLTNTSATAFTANSAGDAVVLNKGAVFINSSGAAAGTPVSVTGTNFFRINNGGRYVHNTARGHTTNLAARLSTVAGTEKGIFEFDVPSAAYTVSLSGRTYGTLILSSTASIGAVTYSGNGTNPLNINGNFQINTGVTFSIGMSGDFIVKGDYNQAISSTFNLQNSNLNNSVKLRGQVVIDGTVTATGTGLPVLDMNGVLNQNLSIVGSILNNVGFRITNGRGVTLLTPLILPYNLNLQNGKIRTSNINILTLVDNATVTGGSSASFVEGPMKKIGEDNFSFPVGKGSIYAPIGFTSAGMAVTDVFQAEYFRLDPQAAYGTNYETPPINHISYVEYWKLEKTSGNTAIPANVTLTVTPTSFAKNINTLYVARYNQPDIQWKNTGILSRSSGPASPPYITGSVTSMPVTQFGVFTLATTEPHEANPLPVNFISFDVRKINSKSALLNWQIADNIKGDKKFEVQRSDNGNDFKVLGVINASEINQSFNFYDDQLSQGVMRYRIKINEGDNSVIYSRVITLFNNGKGFTIISIYPNPVYNDAILSISSAIATKVNLTLYDVSGQKVKQWSESVSTGNSNLTIRADDLRHGVYMLSVSTIDSKQVMQFIKR